MWGNTITPVLKHCLMWGNTSADFITHSSVPHNLLLVISIFSYCSTSHEYHRFMTSATQNRGKKGSCL